MCHFPLRPDLGQNAGYSGETSSKSWILHLHALGLHNHGARQARPDQRTVQCTRLVVFHATYCTVYQVGRIPGWSYSMHLYSFLYTVVYTCICFLEPRPCLQHCRRMNCIYSSFMLYIIKVHCTYIYIYIFIYPNTCLILQTEMGIDQSIDYARMRTVSSY